MWLGLGMGLLSGCGSATKPLPPQSAMLPRIMDPLPIAGHATSVLQAQGQIWVAVQTGHGLSVKLVTTLLPPLHITPTNQTSCAAFGFLRHVGSDTTVTGTGCSNLWVFNHGIWMKRSLPATLVTSGALTGTGDRWWFLAYGVGASGNEAVTLWDSTNKGASWSRMQTSSDHEQPHGLPYFGDKTGLAAGPQNTLWLTGLTMGLGYGWLYQAPANTRNWSSIPLPVQQKWAGAELTTYPPVFTGSHGAYLPVTVYGKISDLAIYSRDSSTSQWKLAGAIPAPVGTRWDFTASSSTSLWVTVGNRLWASQDAGTTWREAWTTPAGWNFVSVSFSGPRDGVLLAVQQSGHAYALWVTHDGGKIWTSRRTG
ncbi:MAG: hypothetical protein M1499_00870 [Firmicutes bacterium]|nr:hypothetical protein [Bacillota bacterium]